jgi:hypothetical protein
VAIWEAEEARDGSLVFGAEGAEEGEGGVEGVGERVRVDVVESYSVGGAHDGMFISRLVACTECRVVHLIGELVRELRQEMVVY